MGNKPGSSAKEAVATEKDVRRLAKGTPYDTANVKNLLARFTKIAAASPDPTQIQEQQVRVSGNGVQRRGGMDRGCVSSHAARSASANVTHIPSSQSPTSRVGLGNSSIISIHRDTALGDRPHYSSVQCTTSSGASPHERLCSCCSAAPPGFHVSVYCLTSIFQRPHPHPTSPHHPRRTHTYCSRSLRRC